MVGIQAIIGFPTHQIPSGEQTLLWKITMFYRETHENSLFQLPFLMAMLVLPEASSRFLFPAPWMFTQRF